MGLRRVVERPTTTAPRDGDDIAPSVDAESTTNDETRMVSDWTWKDVRKAFQDFWKRRLRVADDKDGPKFALYAGPTCHR